jgi:hypothetical protein
MAASAAWASNFGMQTKQPSTRAMASSERTPMVWYSGMTPSVRSPA